MSAAGIQRDDRKRCPSGTHERVVVAMSGGVDSSVAAALLAESGYDVIGISMRLAPEAEGVHSTGRASSGCCSLEDFRDAERVARRIGVPHYVFDMRSEFERSVIGTFVDEYLAGRTPSPCILCNREIKFGLLRAKAAELGAHRIATGHYARIVSRDGRWRLCRGRDDAKDQSYFLFEMGQQELAHTLFPVGDLTKDEVRAEAERFGLPVAHKPDSQEICFVADGRYADFVERAAAGRVRPGRVLDENGRELGRHGGVHRFTVGQRKGLGIAAAEPLYVKRIDAGAADVVVAPRAATGVAGLLARSVSWVAGEAEPDGAELQVRIRHKHRPAAARVFALAGGTVRVEFAAPQDAVSPGQAAVFYRDDELIGGGWIAGPVERVDTNRTEAGACA
jgi:tRNA-specific 2-thiouridylase